MLAGGGGPADPGGLSRRDSRSRPCPWRWQLGAGAVDKMSNPAAVKLIQRYQSNYGIPPDSGVTEEMILRHWELEKSLRKALLESNANERRDVFGACYGRLYGELDWLNRLTESENKESPAIRYATWLSVIGQPPQKIYEVGSGKGLLISHLARCGNQ